MCSHPAHPPIMALLIFESAVQALRRIQPAMELDYGVVDERKVQNALHSFTGEADVPKKIIVELLNTLEHPAPCPVVDIPPQVAEERSVELALGLIEHIVAHGKVLLARKNPCSSVGWLVPDISSSDD